MKRALMTSLTLSALVAAALGSAVANAQSFPEKTAYLIDQRGAVAKNAFGQCWRTGYWTPAQAIAECDPDLVKKADAAPKTAPPAVIAGGTPPAVGPAKGKVNKTLSADALFDFDKAVLKAEGKAALTSIIDDMRKNQDVEVVVVSGHTDRLGSDKYNQKLSERRAKAVVEYMSSQGVSEGRIKAEGKGETMPTDATKECKGNAPTKKLIACLQPDRRVEVRVTVQREQ